MVATRILKGLGCRYEVVDNGRKAVQACLDGDFDVVLMDCHMPHMVRRFLALFISLLVSLSGCFDFPGRSSFASPSGKLSCLASFCLLRFSSGSFSFPGRSSFELPFGQLSRFATWTKTADRTPCTVVRVSQETPFQTRPSQ